ncbi:MAG TPA: CpsD/CapB family tyrosine-protein kinase [Terracidiphilus sp.]|jgi:capsular exopolysaccharide synthesis family protein
MSHIFDALQRSEGERAEIDSTAPPEAIELLRNAERRAASKWKTAVLITKTDTRETAEGDTTVGLLTAPPEAMVPEAHAQSEPSLADQHRDIFGQFQALEVVLPPQNRLVCYTDDESLASEAFRLLGVRLQHLRRDRPLRKILITSTIPQEGKSMVAANLACTLALRTHQRVLLLEGDLRRPSLSQEFGLGRNPGLCEYLQGERALAKCIYHLESPGLWILPSGSVNSNALELLQSGRLSALMDQLAAWFDWIIIDSPPILPLADTSVWARLADGILLVTRQGTTDKRQLQRGLEALEPKKLIGALLNCSQSSGNSDYYYRATNVAEASDGSMK